LTVLDGSGLSGKDEEVEGGGTGAGAVEAEAAGASGREERGNDIVCRCEGGKHAQWAIGGRVGAGMRRKGRSRRESKVRLS
jgi:hypothetical protein